jgi:hypothetical protein
MTWTRAGKYHGRNSETGATITVPMGPDGGWCLFVPTGPSLNPYCKNGEFEYEAAGCFEALEIAKQEHERWRKTR